MTWKVKINGTFFIIIIFIVVALSLYAFLFSSNQHYSKIYEVEDGLLEITQKDLNYNITLSGKWRYYENQFHQTSETLPEEYVLVNVPHTFQNPGYGTYAFTLKGLTPGKCYSL